MQQTTQSSLRTTTSSTMQTKNSCYAKLLFPKEDEWKSFADKFNHDVYVERGKNEQGGDKVYIIPFGKKH